MLRCEEVPKERRELTPAEERAEWLVKAIAGNRRGRRVVGEGAGHREDGGGGGVDPAGGVPGAGGAGGDGGEHREEASIGQPAAWPWSGPQGEGSQVDAVPMADPTLTGYHRLTASILVQAWRDAAHGNGAWPQRFAEVDPGTWACPPCKSALEVGGDGSGSIAWDSGHVGRACDRRVEQLEAADHHGIAKLIGCPVD